MICHVPVLAREVVAWLVRQPGGTYLDCTVGQGGHAALILERSSPDGVLIGIDRDPDAIAATGEQLARFAPRMRLGQGNFSALKQHLKSVGVAEVDGVIFDLGVSSAQLDRPERGLSFLSDGPLDMRMDQRAGRTAADLVAQLPERELADLIYQYGEERYSRRIARAIIAFRKVHPLRTTFDLVSVVSGSVPAAYRHGRIHCATRTFQALRIAVNQELDVIEGALRDAVDVLAPGGRLCVISFHSLEDRIAKQTFRSLAQGSGACLKILTKKPYVPSDEERRDNPRARSAKLRVAERLPERRPT
ncbi:MAG: 16S rRNA (cytosine(1402)-N(4))-methyltransferase RsmH [Nitrospiraceae bacterium]|nr:16S rRNA (cytosine(1402)-N(4))-methyltransferase RsmH [Nitrospiraceae bacterium]